MRRKVALFNLLLFSYGAGNGSRTRNPQLGRLMLYQLSYSRLYEPDQWTRLGMNFPK